MPTTDSNEELDKLIRRFQDYVECEEWHIHSTAPELGLEPNHLDENDHQKYDEERFKADLTYHIQTIKKQERLQTASDIFNLAHEYASRDKTMRGAEELRSYHYYNAIHKIGEFDGR